ncbi:hypothetical protein QVD17_12566 [Tagetes erecta]|uniref:Uncharacterized protein n=1 Tax=Tagetes erecta TaxID=13708 RepID=A0AAD8KZN3_TARER|nr:hypothetical protein QVD17_12566 [Tagetes erecta]
MPSVVTMDMLQQRIANGFSLIDQRFTTMGQHIDQGFSDMKKRLYQGFANMGQQINQHVDQRFQGYESNESRGVQKALGLRLARSSLEKSSRKARLEKARL